MLIDVYETYATFTKVYNYQLCAEFITNELQILYVTFYQMTFVSFNKSILHFRRLTDMILKEFLP